MSDWDVVSHEPTSEWDVVDHTPIKQEDAFGSSLYGPRGLRGAFGDLVSGAKDLLTPKPGEAWISDKPSFPTAEEMAKLSSAERAQVIKNWQQGVYADKVKEGAVGVGQAALSQGLGMLNAIQGSGRALMGDKNPMDSNLQYTPTTPAGEFFNDKANWAVENIMMPMGPMHIGPQKPSGFQAAQIKENLAIKQATKTLKQSSLADSITKNLDTPVAPEAPPVDPATNPFYMDTLFADDAHGKLGAKRNPYIPSDAKLTVDENGMPIRQDLTDQYSRAESSDRFNQGGPSVTNPDTLRVTPEGQAYTHSPEVQMARERAEQLHADIQQTIENHTQGHRSLQQALSEVQGKVQELNFWKDRAEKLQNEALGRKEETQLPPADVLHAQGEDFFNPNPMAGTREQMEGLARSTENITRNQVPPDAVIPRDANKIGVTVPRDGVWVKDENGMPVRQGLPELPPTDTSLTAQTLDTLHQNEGARNDLGNAIQEANGPQLGQDSVGQFGSESWKPHGGPDLAPVSVPTSRRRLPQRGTGSGQGGGIAPGLLVPKWLENTVRSGMDTISRNMDRVMRAMFLRPKDTTSYLQNLPGMGKDADRLVTRPASAESLMEQARNQPDGPAFNMLTKNTQSGMGMVAEKSPNIWVKNAGDWFAYSRRKGELLVRTAVRPLEDMIARLPQDQLIALHKVFQKEMFERQKYTPERLQQAGMTPQMLKVYEGMRKNFDVALEEQNKQRRADGKPEIEPQAAYMASMFQGDYHIPVYNKSVEGQPKRLAWYIQVPTRGEAKQAIQWLKDNQNLHPNADVAKLEYNHDSMYRPGKGFADSPREMLGAWSDLVDLLKDDPASQELANSMKLWIDQQGGKFNRQDLHQVDRKVNIRGFSGDQPWLSDKDNAHTWGKAQVRALENSVRWAPMQETLNNVKQYLSDPTIQDKNPNSVAITKAYMLQHLGVVDNMVKRVENAMGGALGRSSSATRAATDVLKKATYLATIAGSPGYAIATPLQAINASLAYYGKFVGDGTIKMGKGDFLRSMTDAFQGWTHDFKISEANKEALQWAHDNDVVSQSMFDPNRGLGDHPLAATLMKGADYTMSRPDQVTRMHVFLPFANAFAASGKMTKIEAYMKAAQLTDNIMVSMKRNDRPLWVGKAGSLGEAAYVFHAPVFNFYNHLSIFGREASKGNPLPLATYLGATVAMGGLFAAPMANELCDIWDWLKDHVAEQRPDLYPQIQHMDPRAAIYSSGPESSTFQQVLGYGLASTATGVDMHTRFQNDVLDVRDPLKSISPLAQEVKEWGAVGKAMVNPNKNTWLNALHVALPGPMARGILESTNDSYKAGFGEDNGQGYTAMRNPNDITNPDAAVNRSNDLVDNSGILPKPGERGAKLMGVTALSEAQRRNKDFVARQEDKRTQVAMKRNFDEMWSGVFRNDADAIERHATAYIKLGGTGETMASEIQQRAEKLGMPPSQYAQVHANTLAKVLAVVRRKEMDK